MHQINALDTKDELGNLSLEEACERETMTKEFWKTSRIQESNLLQTLQKKLISDGQNPSINGNFRRTKIC